jgi:hypothetical protein
MLISASRIRRMRSRLGARLAGMEDRHATVEGVLPRHAGGGIRIGQHVVAIVKLRLTC